MCSLPNKDGRDIPNRPKAQKRPANLAVEDMHMTTAVEQGYFPFPADDGKDKAAQSFGPAWRQSARQSTQRKAP